MKLSDLFVACALNLKQFTRQVNIIEKIVSNQYPVFEISKNSGAAKSASKKMPRYLIPSFQSLKNLEKNGSIEIENEH